jgi:hypothetical protein
VASDGADLDVDVLAAALRADTADLETFVEVLADKLSTALPGRVSVQRRRAGMLGPKRVHRVVLQLTDSRPEVQVSDGIVEAVWTRVSGGIALKHERVDFDLWLQRLSESLAAEAQRSERTRAALRQLLI